MPRSRVAVALCAKAALLTLERPHYVAGARWISLRDSTSP